MLASLESEIDEAPSLISKMLRTKEKTLPKGSLLIGAGDSYAAALCASNLSPRGAVALDPYELIASPEMARSKTVVFLSVSGRTRSNVSAARRVKGLAAATVAITAGESNPLARSVDRAIILPYDYQPRTPGMTSFSLSLAAATRLVLPDPSTNLVQNFEAGRRASRQLRFSRGGVTFFLGNGALHAISIYAAAKLYEFFGARAAHQRLEEFSHMELFSLRKRDVVNVYEGFDPLKVGRALAKSLKGAGYSSCLAATRASNDIGSVFTAVFATQLAILRWARGLGMTRPYFSGASGKLGISDSMIY